MGYWKVWNKMPLLKKFEVSQETEGVLRDKIDRGRKVVSVLTSPDYKITVGAILQNRKDKLIERLSRRSEQVDVMRSQAELAVLRDIEQDIQAIIRDGKKASSEMKKHEGATNVR